MSFFNSDGELVGFGVEPAEHASSWTLLHPQFTVVAPQPNPVKVVHPA
jgi:hypothetical protein